MNPVRENAEDPRNYNIEQVFDAVVQGVNNSLAKDIILWTYNGLTPNDESFYEMLKKSYPQNV